MGALAKAKLQILYSGKTPSIMLAAISAIQKDTVATIRQVIVSLLLSSKLGAARAAISHELEMKRLIKMNSRKRQRNSK